HELRQLRIGHVGDPALALLADDAARELSLGVDHVVELLLERSLADELVDHDRLSLSDAERAVRRLVLDRGIPPAVEVNDVAGARQVQARAARLEREDEDARPELGLELLDHFLATRARHAAVQEERLAPELVLEVLHEEVAHFLELSEDE